jgi:hypothetical protein
MSPEFQEERWSTELGISALKDWTFAKPSVSSLHLTSIFFSLLSFLRRENLKLTFKVSFSLLQVKNWSHNEYRYAGNPCRESLSFQPHVVSTLTGK